MCASSPFSQGPSSRRPCFQSSVLVRTAQVYNRFPIILTSLQPFFSHHHLLQSLHYRLTNIRRYSVKFFHWKWTSFYPSVIVQNCLLSIVDWILLFPSETGRVSFVWYPPLPTSIPLLNISTTLVHPLSTTTEPGLTIVTSIILHQSKTHRPSTSTVVNDYLPITHTFCLSSVLILTPDSSILLSQHPLH